MTPPTYLDFIKEKSTASIHNDSIVVPVEELNPHAYDFQKDIVRWALAKGRAAVFADCGLGKTLIQLDWSDHVCKEYGGSVLILAPLAVSQQTVSEGEKFGITVNLCESAQDLKPGINITNYEKLEKFKGCTFSGVVLDESSILKSFTGKIRSQIIDFFCDTPFRLACTATPAPNDYMELGNHAEFLGIMSYTEMLSMFFVHDGGKTSKWRLKGHCKDLFWQWMGSWAVVLDSPATLGYSPEGYDLPALRLHEVTSDGQPPVTEVLTLAERRQAKKDAMDEKVRCVVDMLHTSWNDQPVRDKWIIWCELNAEQSALAKALGTDCVSIEGATPDSKRLEYLNAWMHSDVPVLVTKSKIFGFGLNFQLCHNVIFFGLSDSYEKYYQAVRRCWRFGQEYPVDVYIVIGSKEGCVLENVRRKERDCQEMHDAMIEQTKEITKKELKSTCRMATPYIPQNVMKFPVWKEFAS